MKRYLVGGFVFLLLVVAFQFLIPVLSAVDVTGSWIRIVWQVFAFLLLLIVGSWIYHVTRQAIHGPGRSRRSDRR